MILELKLCKGLVLEVGGQETKEEPEVGLPQSFEITTSTLLEGEPMDLIEWADAQKGRALVKLDELCIEELNNQK